MDSQNTRFATLGETGERVAKYVQTCGAIFELAGSWVRQIDHPPVKLVLADHCLRWYALAQIWTNRLPVLREINNSLLLERTDLDPTFSITDLKALDQPGPVVSAYRVVILNVKNELVSHLEWVSLVSDPMVKRSLRVSIDELDRFVAELDLVSSGL